MHTGTIKPTHTTALHTCPNCGNQDVDVERDGEFTPSVLRTHCNRCKRETTNGVVTNPGKGPRAS